jgi:tetratricopeptide (TPR) repeat protein
MIIARETELAAVGMPPDPDLAFQRGIRLEALARYQESLAAFREAASLLESQGKPADPAIQRQIALVLFRMNQYKDSLAAVIDGARLRNELGLPEDWELSRIRGNCACRLGHYDDALSAYNHAERIQRAQGMDIYPFLSMNRGVVFKELTRYDDALVEFDNTARLLEEQGLPPDHDLEMNRGVVFLNQLRFEDALAAYDRAEVLRTQAGLPEDANLLMNRGLALSNLGKHAEALALYARSEELRSERGQRKDPLLMFHRALTLHSAGQTDLAIEEALQTIDEASRQKMTIKSIYIERLRDWMADKLPGAGNVSGPPMQPLATQNVPSADKQYDVFISYRRKVSQGHAMLLHNHLTQCGLEVFRDQDDLPQGPFRESLIQAVQNSRYLIVLLCEGFFERCSNENDEVRRELRAALECGTTIIPVMMEGYVWPDSSELPEDIRGVSQINAISFSGEFFYAFIDKLMRWMV